MRSAETAVLNQRRLAVDLAGRALDTRVQLARALGGGFAADDATRRLAADTQPRQNSRSQ